jgi:hypothetical protein
MSSDPDVIYYNVSVFNDTKEKAVMKYEETRSGEVLANPSKYQVAVARFNVPGTLIPISIFDNDHLLLVRLTWDDCSVTERVVYIDRRTENARPPTYENAIYSINGWMDIINYAYLQAIIRLTQECPTFPPTDDEGNPIVVVAPEFSFDPETQLISMFSQTEWYAIRRGHPFPRMGVQMNLALYSKFATFDSFAVENILITVPPSTIFEESFQQISVRQRIEQPSSIPTGITKTTQESISLSLFNDAHTIVFQSSSLPISTEFLPADDDNRNVTRAILTDFLIPEGINDRSDIQFAGSGLQLRWIDMNSEVPLRSIDIAGYWMAKDQKLNPLFIPPYDLFTCKLAFRLKPRYAEKREKHTIKYSIHEKNPVEGENDQEKNDIK